MLQKLKDKGASGERLLPFFETPLKLLDELREIAISAGALELEQPLLKLSARCAELPDERVMLLPQALHGAHTADSRTGSPGNDPGAAWQLEAVDRWECAAIGDRHGRCRMPIEGVGYSWGLGAVTRSCVASNQPPLPVYG